MTRPQRTTDAAFSPDFHPARPVAPRAHPRPVLAALLATLLAACETLPPPRPAEPPPPVVTPAPPTQPVPPPVIAPQPPAPAVPPPVAKPAPPRVPVLARATWDDLPGWRTDDLAAAWSAFLTGCGALKARAEWQAVCAAAAADPRPDRNAVRRFFETRFAPWRVQNADGTDQGLVTGYYEPLLRGSRKKSARFRFPVYGTPQDLLVVDLAEVYPELKGMRLRGRIEGRRVVPYYTRAQIDNGAAPLAGREIVWVDDLVDLFFLQVQGSGRVRLDTGETLLLGYAEQNGHPYRSIGRLLVERGDLPLEKASMQGIRQWGRENPDRLTDLLNHNASFVFFREMPPGLPGPLGSLGVPLTAGRSIAVDARYVPLGAPVFLDTTWPNSKKPLARLVMAQDTGGAIRGNVRVDFFWGFGEEATREAGRMRQSGRMWVLWPEGVPLPAADGPPN